MRMARFERHGQIWNGVLVGDHLEAGGQQFSLDEVRPLAPVVPSKVVCLGRNYREHADELGRDVPEQPLLFFKPPSSIIGPEDFIVLPPSDRVDYEGELAVVIGRTCHHVSASEANKAILGYTCLNDITDRAAQKWEQNWVRAKAFDTSCPIGPWLVTSDELRFPLTVETWVNGTMKQRADTRMMLVSIPQAIAEISRIMTLEEGDVIATGTPAGVGPLRPGDRVEVRIEGIGTLANPVRGPAS